MAIQLSPRVGTSVAAGVVMWVMMCCFLCVNPLTVDKPSDLEVEVATQSVVEPYYGCESHVTSHASRLPSGRAYLLSSFDVGEKDFSVYLCLHAVGIFHCVWQTEIVPICV
jgi:hypothetical protein